MKKLVVLEGFGNNGDLCVVGRIANIARAAKRVRAGVKNIRARVQARRGRAAEAVQEVRENINSTAQTAIQQQAAQVAELQRIARAAEVQNTAAAPGKIPPAALAAAGIGAECGAVDCHGDGCRSDIGYGTAQAVDLRHPCNAGEVN